MQSAADGWSLRTWRKREGDNLRAGRRAEIAAATRRNHHVLPAVFTKKRHRHRVRTRVELRFPELLTGSRVERAETAVDRRADEDQAAARGDAPADVERTGVGKPLRLERLHEPEGHLPGDVAAVHID